MKLLPLLSATVLITGTLGGIAYFALAQTFPVLITPIKLADSHSSSFAQASDQASDDGPTGGLFVTKPNGEKQAFPLKHTDVNAKVVGNVSRVEVTQTFQNPFDEPLEAVYVFPLPDEAAVDDMEIRIGDRTIKGVIKRREEAQRIYEEARREGRTAGLLEQERDNIFTQSLANIRPGEEIKVIIRYTDSLQFEGGNYEFVFPMVVGPRYIPGQPIDSRGNTTQVPDGDRISPPVLKPGTRSGHDIGVTVDIDAGVPVQDVRSPSHAITLQRNGKSVRIQLAKNDTIPNKDLILRYQVSGDRTEATVLAQSDERGGHFALYLIPAVEYRKTEIVPKDVVFLMDTSGSQAGDPLLKSKELMRRFIKGLNPNDTFTIIDFANSAQTLSPKPLANTPENRTKALAYVDSLEASGGTELLNGIQTVLAFPTAGEGRLRSVVLLTDGYIGNDNEVIAEVQRRLQPGNRLYSFGVGSSVNRYLVDRLAEVGRGVSRVVRQDEPTEAVAEDFFQKLNNPVLTNIEVNWDGSGVKPEVYPLAPPDLFANQPLVLFGRKSDGATGALRIRGTVAGGKRYEKVLPVDFRQGDSNPAIAQLWGRARIKDLMTQMVGGETTSGVEAVTNTALSYRLLSQYTAFVAVSEEVRVEPDGTSRRVQVPVELPEGVSYEGIFGETDREEQAVTSPSGNISQTTGGSPTFRSRVPASPTPTVSSRVGASSGDTKGSAGRAQDEAAIPESSTESAPSSQPPSPREEVLAPSVPKPAKVITVARVDGVAPASAQASVTQSLQTLLQTVGLEPGRQGELVFSIQVRNGAVIRVLWDDQASTLKDQTVVNAIRQALQNWRSPQPMTKTLGVTLRVQS